MRKIILALGFCLSALCAQNSPFADTPQQKSFYDEDGSVFSDEDFESGEMSSNAHTDKMMFLDSVQKHFWNPRRKLQDNNMNILHKDGDTHMFSQNAITDKYKANIFLQCHYDFTSFREIRIFIKKARALGFISVSLFTPTLYA